MTTVPHDDTIECNDEMHHFDSGRYGVRRWIGKCQNIGEVQPACELLEVAVALVFGREGAEKGVVPSKILSLHIHTLSDDCCERTISQQMAHSMWSTTFTVGGQGSLRAIPMMQMVV